MSSEFIISTLLNILIALVSFILTEHFVKARERSEAEVREKDDAARRAQEALGHLKSAYYQIESSERYIAEHVDDFDDGKVTIALRSIASQLDALRAQMIGNMGQWKSDLLPDSADLVDLDDLIKNDRQRRDIILKSQRSRGQRLQADRDHRRRTSSGGKAEPGSSVDETVDALLARIATVDEEVFMIALAQIHQAGRGRIGESVSDTVKTLGDAFVEARPDSDQLSTVLNRVSMAMYTDDNYSEGLDYIDRALSINANDVAYIANKSDLLEGLEEYDRAGENFERLIEVVRSGSYESDAKVALTKCYVFSVKHNRPGLAESSLECLRAISEEAAEDAILQAKLLR